MSFQSLNQVLGDLKSQYKPKENALQRIIRHWPEIVGSVVAVQAQPIAVHRGVLRVATSSSAWAQNLVFERQRILEKVNTQLSLDLVDIRFSPAQWQQQPANSSFREKQEQLWQEHPSLIKHLPVPKLKSDEVEINSVQAFQRWSELMRSRSRSLPVCPQCHCPTPQGELDRWSICSLCVVKQW